MRMGSVPSALAFLLMIFAGRVNRQQLIVIDFLKAENRLLKERLRGKRIRFTDAERAWLARKAKAVGRKALLELGTIAYCPFIRSKIRGRLCGWVQCRPRSLFC